MADRQPKSISMHYLNDDICDTKPPYTVCSQINSLWLDPTLWLD